MSESSFQLGGKVYSLGLIAPQEMTRHLGRALPKACQEMAEERRGYCVRRCLIIDPDRQRIAISRVSARENLESRMGVG